MNNKFESVEERVRNAVSPMWNIAAIIKDLQNQDKSLKQKQAIYDFLIDHTDIPTIIKNNIEYLISIANEVDKHLPKDFSINDHIDYEAKGLS